MVSSRVLAPEIAFWFALPTTLIAGLTSSILTKIIATETLTPPVDDISIRTLRMTYNQSGYRPLSEDSLGGSATVLASPAAHLWLVYNAESCRAPSPGKATSPNRYRSGIDLLSYVWAWSEAYGMENHVCERQTVLLVGLTNQCRLAISCLILPPPALTQYICSPERLLFSHLGTCFNEKNCCETQSFPPSVMVKPELTPTKQARLELDLIALPDL